METDIRLYITEKARKSYVLEAVKYTKDFLKDVLGDKTLNVTDVFRIPDELVRKHCEIVTINGEEYIYPSHKLFHTHGVKKCVEERKYNFPMGGVFHGRKLANRVDQKIDDWELVKSRKLDEKHIEIYGIVSGNMYPTVTAFYENSYYSFPHEIGHILLNLGDHGGGKCLMHPPAKGEEFPEPKLCNKCPRDIELKDRETRLTKELGKILYKRIPKEFMDELEGIKKINL